MSTRMTVARAICRGAPSTIAATEITTAPRRWRMPVRLLIVGWVLVLTAGVLIVVNIASRQALLNEVDQQVTETLHREIGEFTVFAALGTDPGTAQPFVDVSAMFAGHLQRQSPDDDEILFGIVDAVPGSPIQPDVVRQFDPPPYDVSADGQLRAALLAAAGAAGSLDTPEGELRWEKRRAVAGAGGSSTGWFFVGYFIDRDRAEVFESMSTLVAFSLVGFVLAGLGAWLVSGRILAPVRLVGSVAADITERDLNRRIVVHGRDEMSALADQFNAMLDRLQAAFAAQNAFIDAASHELRTPITVVRGNLELMGDDPSERAETVALATEELDRLDRIVEDLLLLSRSHRPDFVVPRPVPLVEIVCDAFERATSLGDRQWLLDDIADRRVVVDAQRLQQALLHLTRNAVQHTNPGDEIRLGSRLDERGLRLWVSDSGPGPPDRLEEVFNSFSRGAVGGARGTGTGAGLGLAVVKAVAEAHGGSVTMRSGAGATVVLDLPVAQLS